MSDSTHNMSPKEKQFLITIHKKVSDCCNELTELYDGLNPFDFLNKIKSFVGMEQLNLVRRIFLNSITECLSTFIFYRTFSNELLYLKSIDPLKQPSHFMDVFIVITTNLENFQSMVEQFLDSDYRDEILSDEKWIQTDRTGAKVAKNLFMKNDVFKDRILELKDDLFEFCKKHGLKGF